MMLPLLGTHVHPNIASSLQYEDAWTSFPLQEHELLGLLEHERNWHASSPNGRQKLAVLSTVYVSEELSRDIILQKTALRDTLCNSVMGMSQSGSCSLLHQRSLVLSVYTACLESDGCTPSAADTVVVRKLLHQSGPFPEQMNPTRILRCVTKVKPLYDAASALLSQLMHEALAGMPISDNGSAIGQGVQDLSHALDSGKHSLRRRWVTNGMISPTPVALQCRSDLRTWPGQLAPIYRMQ